MVKLMTSIVEVSSEDFLNKLTVDESGQVGFLQPGLEGDKFFVPFVNIRSRDALKKEILTAAEEARKSGIDNPYGRVQYTLVHVVTDKGAGVAGLPPVLAVLKILPESAQRSDGPCEFLREGLRIALGTCRDDFAQEYGQYFRKICVGLAPN